MLTSSRGGCESRVAREGFIFHCGAEAAPVVIVAASDCYPTVVVLILSRRLIDAVGCEDGIGISDSFADSAVDRVVENRGTEKMNRAFSLRLIDVLADAGAAPIIERRKKRHRSKPRRHVIRQRAEDYGRSAVRA